MINFFVETDAHDDGTGNRLVYSAVELGLNVLTPESIKFGQTIHDVVNKYAGQPFVFQGSLTTLKKLQAEHSPHYIKPLVWCDWEKLSCHYYYSHYGPFLLQQEYGFYPFSELPRLKEFLFKTYGNEGQIFVRPDENNKCFTGKVVKYENFDPWLQLAGFYQPDPESLAIVSRPSKLMHEWRFIVADGKVVSGSQYWETGGIVLDSHYPKEAAEFAEEIAAEWSPHPIFVVDVARTSEYKFRLVEIGSANGCGFYDCDVLPVVDAMAKIALRETNQ